MEKLSRDVPVGLEYAVVKQKRACRETAQLTKARLEAQQAQIAAMEASAEAREAAWAAREQRFDEMAQRLESMSDAEHDMPQRPQRNVKGRGIGSYRSSRLRMDEDDGDDDK